jgi:hypothetical protein
MTTNESNRCKGETKFYPEDDVWNRSNYIHVRCEKDLNHVGVHIWHSKDKTVVIAWPDKDNS